MLLINCRITQIKPVDMSGSEVAYIKPIITQ